MEIDYDSVDNVKRWIRIIKAEGFTCAKLSSFGVGCDNCSAHCRMEGNNEVINCVLRDIRVK